MALTVKQLREALEGYPDDMAVHYEAESHDHWQTMLAPPVYGIGQADIAKSDYHRQFKVVDEDQSREDLDSDPTYVVLLSAWS